MPGHRSTQCEETTVRSVAAAETTTPASTRVMRATEPDGTTATRSTRGRVIDSPARKAMKLSTLASAERRCSGRLVYLMPPVAARAVPGSQGGLARGQRLGEASAHHVALRCRAHVPEGVARDQREHPPRHGSDHLGLVRSDDPDLVHLVA